MSFGVSLGRLFLHHPCHFEELATRNLKRKDLSGQATFGDENTECACGRRDDRGGIGPFRMTQQMQLRRKSTRPLVYDE